MTLLPDGNEATTRSVITRARKSPAPVDEVGSSGGELPLAMTHQTDQQIGLAKLLLVDAARVSIARAEAFHMDQLEAVQSIDRPGEPPRDGRQGLCWSS